jgi:hypothetical protein
MFWITSTGMTDMDEKQRLTNLLGQLSVNYRRELTEADVANFKLMLRRWGIDRLESAIHAHMFDPDGGQYFPNISNIAKHAEGTSKQKEAAVVDKASLAWSCIETAIRRIGSYGTLKLDDKQALATVKAMGGWQDLCATETDKMEWRRKEFIRLYETFERTPVDALPSNLPGRIELAEHKEQAKGQLQTLAQIAERMKLEKQ